MRFFGLFKPFSVNSWHADPAMSGSFSVWSEPRDTRYYARRAALVVLIAAAHFWLLWLVLFWDWAQGPSAVRAQALTTIEVAQVTTPSAPAKPAPPVKVQNPIPSLALPSAMTVPTPPAASGNGAGAGCGMAGLVGKSISGSPEAMTALATLPPEVRSDADAVMLWNGGWMDIGEPSAASPLTAALSPDPLAPLKQVVIDALAAAPIECRDVGELGPQLIPIVEPGRTTMLVIGSGAWKWSDLIDPAIIEPQSSDGAAPLVKVAGPVSTGH